MTRAPQSARCRLARGAAIACSSETTVTPDSGSSASFRSMQSSPLPLTLSTSAGDKPTTPRTFCDDGIMPLFCPTSQTSFRKIRKSRSAKFNANMDLATVHGVVFAFFVLGGPCCRDRTRPGFRISPRLPTNPRSPTIVSDSTFGGIDAGVPFQEIFRCCDYGYGPGRPDPPG